MKESSKMTENVVVFTFFFHGFEACFITKTMISYNVNMTDLEKYFCEILFRLKGTFDNVSFIGL